MDKNMDFNGYPGFSGYDPNNFDPTSAMDPVFNPILQYEQAYSYYKYLCMQMDYKIKCKEYEMMCGKPENKNRVERKIE